MSVICVLTGGGVLTVVDSLGEGTLNKHIKSKLQCSHNIIVIITILNYINNDDH